MKKDITATVIVIINPTFIYKSIHNPIGNKKNNKENKN